MLTADDVQRHVGAPPDLRQAGLEDRGTPGTDEVDDLLGALEHDQLGVSGESHDGVRGRLDRQDQIGVEEELLLAMTEAVKTDHVPVFGTQGRALNADGRGDRGRQRRCGAATSA